ncbi:MAG: NADH-quinone oxidoreductase subunit A [Methanomassiliicoccaceae archaeon]|jgi:NADH:ubiquinone oxidoreductase subunit 3 (subunit A)|nr:NADH-quinone oxidoreductase subunit A [Methanomassiliicoccaceae archaeon]
MSLIVDYLPLAILAVLAVGFAPLAWLLSRFFRPNKPSQWRDTTYECGSEPIGEAQVQFKFQYYVFGIIFVVFDLIATFLMLWAVAFDALSDMAKLWAVLFLVILLIGVAYALKKEGKIWI